jgi:hypothetical protein
MIKIIDLDIEGTITGDTKVTEIALVEMPAIEQNFIYFTKQEFVCRSFGEAIPTQCYFSDARLSGEEQVRCKIDFLVC